MGKLEGKVAVVTGAGKGIGRAIALAFAREGARVVLADIDADALRRVHGEIRRAGPKGKTRCVVVKADVSREEEVEALFARALQAFGRVDILVNNAGIILQKRLTDTASEEWDRILTVDLKGVFLCCKHALRDMLRRRSGKIINIASQLGYLGAPEATAYSAAKGGVIAFTKALAREVAPHVQVNGIAPGPIETDLLRGMSKKWRRWKKAQLPLRRFGRPEEVAPTAVFLASRDADYYTGQTLGPNGGDYMP